MLPVGTALAMLLGEDACRALATQNQEHTMKHELIAMRGLFIFGSIGMLVCTAAMLFGL